MSQLLYLHYLGDINVTEAEAAVFGGKAAEGPTPWGNICMFYHPCAWQVLKDSNANITFFSVTSIKFEVRESYGDIESRLIAT